MVCANQNSTSSKIFSLPKSQTAGQMKTPVLPTWIKFDSIHGRKARRIESSKWPLSLICDVFKGEWIDAVKKCNSKLVCLFSSCTNYFQQLDLTVSKSSKDLLHQVAQSWYSQKIFEQMEVGKRSDKIDVCVSVVKPSHVNFMIT